jgi:glucose-1-phosphate thymidylyltransferase
MPSRQEIVGLVPAAGRANRISPLPLSKELYPIGFRGTESDRTLRPKVVCHYLLEKMRLAGITRAYVVLKKGKWDILNYLGDGSLVDMSLAYLMMGLPHGVPYTLDQAYPYIRDEQVAFGFPDILFQPDEAFFKLIGYQTNSHADVVLGLFPTDQPHKVDIVDFDQNGIVRQIIIRPPQSRLRYTWGIAAWRPVFTQFIHEYLVKRNASSEEPELFMGQIFHAAVQHGLRIEGVAVSSEPYIDIGTPEDLRRALQIYG